MLKGYQALEEVKNRLINKFKPQAIILFGSYAWGQPNEDSDLDLLIIKDGPETRHQLGVQAIKLMFGIDHALDMLVFKPEDIQKKNNSFFFKIFQDGKLLYGRL